MLSGFVLANLLNSTDDQEHDAGATAAPVGCRPKEGSAAAAAALCTPLRSDADGAEEAHAALRQTFHVGSAAP